MGIIRWDTAAGDVVLRQDADGPVRLVSFGFLGVDALPLVELRLTGEGRAGISGKRGIGGAASARLRYVDHLQEAGRLVVRQVDPGSGLGVTTHFRAYPGIPVVRTWVELVADRAVAVDQVASFVLGGLGRPGSRWEDELYLWLARNPWSGEFRWAGASLAGLGIHDVGMVRFGQTGSKNRVSVTSVGSWSSGEYLPMGAIHDVRADHSIAWQIEHNGSWHYELGDCRDNVYLLASGPAQAEHQWVGRLEKDERFVSVEVAISLVEGGPAEALAELTRYRRESRRSHHDNVTLPVVFNDFMNCLMADPATGKVIPLVDAAAAAGAEYYCVDAGWYGENDDWWDAVGEWEPSVARFPGGLAEVIDRIRAKGMIPGLWLEPEVVGVRSPIAEGLPAEAFFQREGVRLVECGRYQLDLRHPAAIAHLDRVIDRLITEFGIGYFKFDYNIDIGPGTDTHGNIGAGLLGHNRAYLGWLDKLMDRYPGLVIENCAAGGMRIDHAMLSRLPIQSVTDQQDHRLMPAIAAAAPTAVTPEQGAVWAYPQPEFESEEIALTLINAMLGRIHLSGRIDLLDARQASQVEEAVTVYKTYREQLSTGVPRWPLGLPGWRDEWAALAIDCGLDTFLAVWRRDTVSASATLKLRWLQGQHAEVTQLFPAGRAVDAWWRPDPAQLHVNLPAPHTARLFRLRRPAQPVR